MTTDFLTLKFKSEGLEIAVKVTEFSLSGHKNWFSVREFNSK